MDELLKKLLETDLLNEETKAELTEQVQSFISTKIDEHRQLVEQEVRAELTQSLSEQWVQERESLIEALDAKTSDILSAELAELKEDIERFRDLEAEYAGKLVEQKQELAETLHLNITQLAEMLDQFVFEKLSAELDELKEDIAENKKLAFGRKVFETFVREYQMNFVSQTDIEKQLAESATTLTTVQEQLAESQKALDAAVREKKMTELLSNIAAGRPRNVMETILKTVPTEKLDEAYAKFLDRVLKESVKPTAKETGVLAEGAQEPTQIEESVVLNGDTQPTAAELQEGVEQHFAAQNNADLEKLRRWAGVRA